MAPNEIVAAERRRLGLSQRELALRAGVTQAAISRIERGLEAPSWARFEQIMLAMGVRPLLTTEAIPHGVDAGELAAGMRLAPEQRLRESISWNLVMSKLESAGADARVT